jgi:hypothetical protein
VKTVRERPRGNLALERVGGGHGLGLAGQSLHPRVVEAEPVDKTFVELPFRGFDVGPARSEQSRAPLPRQGSSRTESLGNRLVGQSRDGEARIRSLALDQLAQQRRLLACGHFTLYTCKPDAGSVPLRIERG